MDEWDLALALCDVPDEFVIEAAGDGIFTEGIFAEEKENGGSLRTGKGKRGQKAVNGRRKITDWLCPMAVAAAVVLFVMFAGGRLFFVRGELNGEMRRELKYKVTKLTKINVFKPKTDVAILSQKELPLYDRYPQLALEDGSYQYSGKAFVVITDEKKFSSVPKSVVGRGNTSFRYYTLVSYDTITDEIELEIGKKESAEYVIGGLRENCRLVRTELARKDFLFFRLDLEILRENELGVYNTRKDGTVAVKCENEKYGYILYYLYEKTEKEEQEK